MNTKQNRRRGKVTPPGRPGLLKMPGTTGLIWSTFLANPNLISKLKNHQGRARSPVEVYITIYGI